MRRREHRRLAVRGLGHEKEARSWICSIDAGRPRTHSNDNSEAIDLFKIPSRDTLSGNDALDANIHDVPVVCGPRRPGACLWLAAGTFVLICSGEAHGEDSEPPALAKFSLVISTLVQTIRAIFSFSRTGTSAGNTFDSFFIPVLNAARLWRRWAGCTPRAHPAAVWLSQDSPSAVAARSLWKF